MKTYSDEQKRLRQQDKKETESAISESAINAWLATRREIIDCDATRRIILEYFAGVEIRAASMLEEAYKTHEQLRNALALVLQTEDEERHRLEKRIIELMRPGISPQGLEGIRAAFQSHNVDELARLRLPQSIEGLRSKVEQVGTRDGTQT